MNRRHFLTALGTATLAAACAPSAATPTTAPAKPPAAPTAAPAATAAKPAAATTPAAAPTAAAKTAAPAAPKALVKFRVGEIANVFENAYSFVGQDRGTYRDQGIDVEFVDFRDGGTMLKALLAEEIDLSEGGIEPLFPAVISGAELKVVGATRPRLNFLMFAKTSIKSVPELKGKSIAAAAPGSFLHNIAVALLQKHGVKPEEVEFVNVGSSPDVFRAVDGGKVDAGSGSYDFLPTAEKNPDIHVIANISEELPLYQRVSLYTTDKVLKERRDAALNFMKGIALSIRYGIENKEDIIRVGTTRLNRNAEEVAYGHDQEIKHRVLAPNLEFSPQNIEFMQNLLVTVGTISSPLPFDRVATLDLQKRVVADLGEYRYK